MARFRVEARFLYRRRLEAAWSIVQLPPVCDRAQILALVCASTGSRPKWRAPLEADKLANREARLECFQFGSRNGS